MPFYISPGALIDGHRRGVRHEGIGCLFDTVVVEGNSLFCEFAYGPIAPGLEGGLCLLGVITEKAVVAMKAAKYEVGNFSGIGC
jgi:hypothetical protein